MSRRLALLAALAAPLVLWSYLAQSNAQQPGSDNWNALELQYAEANLALAKARLAIAQHENAELADSVSPETLGSLVAGVALAQGRLDNLQGKAGDPNAGYIAEAQARLNGAEEDYQNSLRANSIDADAVPAVMLEQEQAEIAVAKARLAMLEVLNDQPAEVRLNWEIRQLQDEIRALWNRPLIRN